MKKQEQKQAPFSWGKAITIILGVILVLTVVFFGDIPSKIEVYKYTQSAKVSLGNDDLEGALMSYEKAYELANSDALSQDILKIKNLIESKSNYIKAEKFAQELYVDSAYLYYGKVIKEDKVRYEQALDKRNEMAEKIVENIYTQAQDLYDMHLFPMVIGRLQLALDYNVKIEETEKRISEYNSHFYEYYLNKARMNVEKFFGNEMFYNNFMQDFNNATLYAQNDEEIKAVEELQVAYLTETINGYLNLANDALNSSNQSEAATYLQLIIELDADNKEAKELLSTLNI